MARQAVSVTLKHLFLISKADPKVKGLDGCLRTTYNNPAGTIERGRGSPRRGTKVTRRQAAGPEYRGERIMERGTITSRKAIIAVLVLQLIPLVLFPPDSLSPNTQEWWLPVLLAVLVLVADFELIVRRSSQLWPWYLISFSQGFNIISRLMMVWPHATKTVGGMTVLNVPYVALTVIAMGLSAILLWYMELPDVRMGLVRD
jgi:hypothetical protein